MLKKSREKLSNLEDEEVSCNDLPVKRTSARPRVRKSESPFVSPSLKEDLIDGETKKVLKLQGDHIDNIQNFLISINITNFTTRDFKSI